MPEAGSTIVIDIGKTVAKMTLWSRGGHCLARETRPNGVPPVDSFTPLDTAATADWVVQTLAQFAAHPVEAIIPVSHGAAVAGIRQGALAFASPDYEWSPPAEELSAYRAQRDPFSLTGSPALPAGLNLGVQLHYLEKRFGFDDTTLMPYAQYWAWLLSGEAVSEVTSLGCHSDLWCPALGDFSPMAKARGWASRFAPLLRAGDAAGTLRPELAKRTGLSPQVRIHAGLHDSNAALLAARAFPEIGGNEATVLSTGTWFIAMRTPAGPVDLAALPAERDCLVNVDAYGRPGPSARYMGGREIELLGTRIDRPGVEGLAEVVRNDAMVLPSHVPGCGPFPDASGRWINRPESDDERRAAVALYAALMADASLDLIGARDTLLVEGRFAEAEVFVRALASLRPGTRVFTADADNDVSFGALRLIHPQLHAQGKLTPVIPLDFDLTGYRAAWRSSMDNGI